MASLKRVSDKCTEDQNSKLGKTVKKAEAEMARPWGEVWGGGGGALIQTSNWKVHKHATLQTDQNAQYGAKSMRRATETQKGS